MPNGFWYAGGDYTTEKAKAASAFSKGDLLMLDSSSSLSRIPSVATGTYGNDIVGVALSSSLQSIDGFIPYLVPQRDTEFWASFASNIAAAMLPGQECDAYFAVANNRYYLTNASSNSGIAVIVRGNADVSQSVQSRVKVRLMYTTGSNSLIDF
jgi:hypothetical protein